MTLGSTKKANRCEQSRIYAITLPATTISLFVTVCGIAAQPINGQICDTTEILDKHRIGTEQTFFAMRRKVIIAAMISHPNSRCSNRHQKETFEWREYERTRSSEDSIAQFLHHEQEILSVSSEAY